jgi:hypothetical protein
MNEAELKAVIQSIQTETEKTKTETEKTETETKKTETEADKTETEKTETEKTETQEKDKTPDVVTTSEKESEKKVKEEKLTIDDILKQEEEREAKKLAAEEKAKKEKPDKMEALVIKMYSELKDLRDSAPATSSEVKETIDKLTKKNEQLENNWKDLVAGKLTTTVLPKEKTETEEKDKDLTEINNNIDKLLGINKK